MKKTTRVITSKKTNPQETLMDYLVAYMIGPNNYRGRWMKGRNYDEARSQLRSLGFLIYTAPIALAQFQIDNPK